MHQTLYSKSPGTGVIKQQNVSLQISLPDSENGLNSPQITTTDSVPKNGTKMRSLISLARTKTSTKQQKSFN